MAPAALPRDVMDRVRARLREGNLAFAARYPGDPEARQPVHTVYGGAHLFRADTARKLGALAVKHLDEYAPDPASLVAALGLADRLDGGLAATLHERVRSKLVREAVEDLRIDFEDGYGHRPDAEEDAHAEAAARELARGLVDGTLPPFIGIRVKPLSEELAHRAIGTLERFLATLAAATAADGAPRLPAGFVVTLPKVTHAGQVAALADVLDALEPALGFAPRTIAIELMVETPQSLVGPDGRVALPALVEAGRGRVRGAHFGTYDYTAALNVTAAHQSMRHPTADLAVHLMQLALAQTGVTVSDGATTVMPVPPHRAKAGEVLTAAQRDANREVVHRAWRVAFDDVGHGLARGIYQGWDLHPGQLVPRYAAVFSFFLQSLDAASRRLDNFMRAAATATLHGDVFDDAATGQGLINYFLRGLNCGALGEAEVTAAGLTPAEVRSRSFVKILSGRRAAAAGGVT